MLWWLPELRLLPAGRSYLRVCKRRTHSLQGCTFEPLRILYCGSDEFSSHILECLHEASAADTNLICSIDVVNKQAKRAGRGLKTAKPTPCAQTALKLGLSHHEISTFTGWQPPPINLVIAVSFGLLIPPRILGLARYGGLNVHPSLLPDLWGPAPLHHTLLEGRKSSGVTLQTLHPKHFDKGRILASKSFDLPDETSLTFPRLRDLAMRQGADLLIESLRKGSFAQKSDSEVDMNNFEEGDVSGLSHARKITSEDAHVDWRSWSAARAVRTVNALGRIWSEVGRSKRGKIVTERVIWKDLARACDVAPDAAYQMAPGELYGITVPGRNDRLTVVKAADGGLLVVKSLGIEGYSANTSINDAARMLGRKDL